MFLYIVCHLFSVVYCLYYYSVYGVVTDSFDVSFKRIFITWSVPPHTGSRAQTLVKLNDERELHRPLDIYALAKHAPAHPWGEA